MQAMDTAAADLYEEDGKDLAGYDFEPLPTLPEDEENVSLADILSLRDSGLSEQEAWAVCLECSLSMRSVAHAAIFQTLCITPDTLAFNTSGNVCFMEQLSDDPEGAFVPPEFDVTGNTFEVLKLLVVADGEAQRLRGKERGSGMAAPGRDTWPVGDTPRQPRYLALGSGHHPLGTPVCMPGSVAGGHQEWGGGPRPARLSPECRAGLPQIAVHSSHLHGACSLRWAEKNKSIVNE
ncbi:kinase non-catalytic C-lobe domain-containing protein 1-like [Phoca vitulina]|uniref:kinase non-catalytic C-lobe domain-containing protein 1-like n=1 Tax=Phoca vitulina TaxID=9720 RepID=UPI001395EFC8|nr:kinase non-catalytic C-lobe domain-containing protein 1-like [Phoca vitulina]XP_032255594.1 kinase non-catalytic C-lobe domain-containing protein 1-like [Phoca vitulina]